MLITNITVKHGPIFKATNNVNLRQQKEVTEIKGRKVVIRTTLTVRGEVCARGEVVAVQMPNDWLLDDS